MLREHFRDSESPISLIQRKGLNIVIYSVFGNYWVYGSPGIFMPDPQNYNLHPTIQTRTHAWNARNLNTT